MVNRLLMRLSEIEDWIELNWTIIFILFKKQGKFLSKFRIFHFIMARVAALLLPMN
jgi:hypothetical protein